jgi:hypothetical protein
MKKKLIFGSIFILSACLVFVGCNPQGKGEGTKTPPPAKKNEVNNKVEGAKKDVQKKVDDTKKYLDEKAGKTNPTSSLNNEVPGAKNPDKVAVEKLVEKPAVKTDEVVSKSVPEKKDVVIEQIKKSIADENKPLDVISKPLDITKEEKEIRKDIMEQVVQAKEKAKAKPIEEEDVIDGSDDDSMNTLDDEDSEVETGESKDMHKKSEDMLKKAEKTKP